MRQQIHTPSMDVSITYLYFCNLPKRYIFRVLLSSTILAHCFSLYKLYITCWRKSCKGQASDKCDRKEPMVARSSTHIHLWLYRLFEQVQPGDCGEIIFLQSKPLRASGNTSLNGLHVNIPGRFQRDNNSLENPIEIPLLPIDLTINIPGRFQKDKRIVEWPIESQWSLCSQRTTHQYAWEIPEG